MNMQPTQRLLTLSVLASMAAAPALAQDSHYYLGLGAGQTRAHIDETGLARGQLGAGPTISGISTNDRDTGYKAFVGYQMNRHFGVELGYFNLGQNNIDATTAAPAGTLSGEIRIQGVALDLVGTLPLTDNLSALARLGAQYARTRSQYVGTGGVTPLNPNPSDRQGNVKAGVGLQYAFSPSFLMRGEVERYRASDAGGQRANVNLVSVSLVFPFGRTMAPAPRAAAPYSYTPPAVTAAPAPAPAPVAMTSPAVPPMVVAAPAAPVAPAVRQRVSYTVESMFGFDQAELQPEGRKALDAFAAELRGARFETITVEGHTDRIGSEAYNQKLSQERADAVKAYLSTVGGVDGSKIVAKGMSESAPTTKASDCAGIKSAQLIVCLQPDRRVETEVTGTR